MTRVATTSRPSLVLAGIVAALVLFIGMTQTAMAEEKSSDATLSGLTLSDVDFGEFASGTTSYTANVANRVMSTTVTATTNHSGASYFVRHGGVFDHDNEVWMSVGSNVITVHVTAEDGSTSQTYTVTVTRAPNTPATGAPVILGTVEVGQTLTVDTSGIVDAEGLSSVSYAAFWYVRFVDHRLRGRDFRALIEEGGELTYTVQTIDVGQRIEMEVHFMDDVGNEERLVSQATEIVPRNIRATGAPTISGAAVVGQTLTAGTSGISDADGLTNVTYSYQWLADDTAVDGATSSSYTVQASDLEKVIKVRVDFTDNEGNDESLTSAGTAAVSAGGL